MKFKPITAEDLPTIIKYSRLADFQSSSFTAGVIFLWSADYNLHYYEEDGTIIFKGCSPAAHCYYSYPIGKDPDNLLSQIKKPFSMMYVPENKLAGFPNAEANKLENDFDYVYRYQDLVGLTGKHKAYIRNHINRFLKDHPIHRYEKIGKSNIADLDRILKAQTLSNPGRAADVQKCYAAIKYYEQLPFIGGILYADDIPVAFSIGEVINDMLYVEFEKRVDGVEGASDFNRLSFLLMQKDAGINFVNREDDAGDPGLRISKQRMGPCCLIYKYRVAVK